MQLLDLSQTIAVDMPRFNPTWPTPTITPFLSHTQSAFSGQYSGVTVEISFAQFVTSVGTYLDSPFHFHPDGASIERLDLSKLVLPGVVVHLAGLTAQAPIGPDVLEGVEIAGRAVLFDTGWSNYWGLDEYFTHPFLTEALAVALRDGGAQLVGIDTLIADDPHNPRRPFMRRFCTPMC
ncbi:MAG: cyclase family protein [Oscillochloris sp.]|nr:cyclase family protein [Oscillochloris sp.]